jgi:hypothetical protein
MHADMHADEGWGADAGADHQISEIPCPPKPKPHHADKEEGEAKVNVVPISRREPSRTIHGSSSLMYMWFIDR